MNRIILIGNGFDLAHGLETSYRDFMSSYWKNTLEKISGESSFEDEYIQIKANGSVMPILNSYGELKKYVEQTNNGSLSGPIKLVFKNK